LKSSVYIVLKAKSFSTTKKHYNQSKCFFKYLISNNILSLNKVTQETVLGYRNYLFETYENENIIHDNLYSVKVINKQRKFLPDCFKDNLLKGIEHFFNLGLKTKKSKQTKIIDDLTFKNIVGIANNNLIFTEELISTRLLWEDLKIEYGYYENRKNRTKKDKNNIINKINYRLMKVQSHYKNINDFKSHNNDVVFSCMSLILAYTGMRISEVLSMPVDCLKKKKTHCDDIEYDIYYIKSTTFKYETNAEGVKNTNDMRSEWLANGEVAKAVDVLQRLYQKDRVRSNCDFLFCSVKGDNVKQLSYSYTDEKIKILVNDKTFNMHQFRRTFARFVARSAF